MDDICRVVPPEPVILVLPEVPSLMGKASLAQDIAGIGWPCTRHWNSASLPRSMVTCSKKNDWSVKIDHPIVSSINIEQYDPILFAKFRYV